MSTFCHSVPHSAINAALSSFLDLFGRPIDVWIFAGEVWHHPVAPNPLEAETSFQRVGIIAPDSLPVAPDTIQAPVIQQLTPGVLLIGTPLTVPSAADESATMKVFAWGTVQTTSEQLVASLIRVAHLKNSAECEAAELQKGYEPHLEQISHDFEELTWLRQLSEHLFDCQVDLSLEAVAQRILPELQQLIAARSIVLVSSGRLDATEESQPASGKKPVAWCGPRIIEDERCTQLVSLLHNPHDLSRPTIVNRCGDYERYRALPEVHSCLLMPISHRGICYGWLLALNRANEYARFPASDKSTFWEACHQEFGTGEASLLFSAAGTLASHARNAELFREKERLLIGIVKAMINALDAKDAYTCGHSDRVASTAKRIGERLGLDGAECERLYMSGLLHDIGKIGIPDHVLLKPDRLTEEEFDVIAQHPTIGHAILSHLPQLSSVLPGVLHHHEHLNGRGYPHRLKGQDIPLFGRILAVADAFDAMTTCRPYRKAMPAEKAIGILKDGAGTQWDPEVVEAFLLTIPSTQALAVHNQENLRMMFEAVAAAGQACLSERPDVGDQARTHWNSGPNNSSAEALNPSSAAISREKVKF